MRLLTTLIILAIIAVLGASSSQKIIGGSETTIDKYPFAVAILFYNNGMWGQVCGGTIINNRSILSSAACYWRLSATQFSGRVGSSYAHIGGSVYNAAHLINHPFYHGWSYDYDIAIVRVSTEFSFGPNVRPAAIAGPNYQIPDNASVWVIGWGVVQWQGKPSEQLRDVEIWTVSLSTCRQRYFYWLISDNMLCAGYLDVGGRDFCTGDTGGPLLHNNVVIGIASWGQMCATPNLPGVYTRVPNFTNWIQENA